MNIIVDSNVLLRFLLNDDQKQSVAARKTLAKAQLIALPLPVLCETVWVLLQGYKMERHVIADALEVFINSANVKTNQAAVALGLTLLRAGGDFADGVICSEGQNLGGDTFVSFDKKAARLIKKHGIRVRELL